MKGSFFDKKLGVAIVNYCTPDLVKDCLKSLEQEANKFASCSVYVIDNCSPDDSSSEIQGFIELKNFGRVINLT